MAEVWSEVAARLGRGRLSPVAAAALVADFARHPGPKHALLVGATPDSPVLSAAIDALTPADRLTVIAAAGATDQVRTRVRHRGEWVRPRVQVVAELSQTGTETFDAVVLCQIVTAAAAQLRSDLDELAKHLNPGSVLCLAVAAAGWLAGGAGEELDRQAARHGVGADLVLRNAPPVRVHRLRFAAASAALAQRLAPLERTSSVRITPGCHVDSNGVAAAAICLGAAVLARGLRPRSTLWLLPALAAVPVAAFFRDPHRVVPDDPAIVVAASDGKVLSVERVRDDHLGADEYLRIAVFLSVLDVHVNRSPVAGRVVDRVVVDGGYAAAMRPEAEHNVTTYTVLETTRGTVAVAQRTGLIARRIVHRAPVGALLAKGERFGLIRFGSRTDVYLPVTATPTVAPGDRVRGGESVIATW